jgi:hypothetical protein
MTRNNSGTCALSDTDCVVPDDATLDAANMEVDTSNAGTLTFASWVAPTMHCKAGFKRETAGAAPTATKCATVGTAYTITNACVACAATEDSTAGVNPTCATSANCRSPTAAELATANVSVNTAGVLTEASWDAPALHCLANTKRASGGAPEATKCANAGEKYTITNPCEPCLATEISTAGTNPTCAASTVCLAPTAEELAAANVSVNAAGTLTEASWAAPTLHCLAGYQQATAAPTAEKCSAVNSKYTITNPCVPCAADETSTAGANPTCAVACPSANPFASATTCASDASWTPVTTAACAQCLTDQANGSTCVNGCVFTAAVTAVTAASCADNVYTAVVAQAAATCTASAKADYCAIGNEAACDTLATCKLVGGTWTAGTASTGTRCGSDATTACLLPEGAPAGPTTQACDTVLTTSTFVAATAGSCASSTTPTPTPEVPVSGAGVAQGSVGLLLASVAFAVSKMA